MRALVFDNTPEIRDIPIPQPAEGEALIRVLLAGVCNTDLEILKGYMDFHGVPGHEFVGIVEKASNASLLGQRVVGEINCVCGHCRFCQMEIPHHCAERTTLGIFRRDGAFAEYLALPEANLHIIPEGLSDEQAVFAEPLAAAFRIPEQIDISAHDRAIVLGDGKLGLLASQVVWLSTKNLVCVGKHSWKLQMLKEQGIPIAHTGDAIEPGADIVVEATGAPSGLNQAVALVRPEGTVVLKTTVASASNVNLSLPVVNEVRIIGSRCGPFRPALQALAQGAIEVRPMISAEYPLEDAVAALHRAAEHSVLKVLIRM